MRSRQSGSNDYDDCNEPDNPTAIPDLARAWESYPQVASSVRRPSTLPDPQSYHEAIEPHAIFELDEKQKNGSIETVLVVPSCCERCRSLRQACSRAQPACTRCRNAGETCRTLQGGYKRLPGPKFARPSMMRKQGTSGTCEKSAASSSTRQGIASRDASLSETLPSNAGSSVASGSKRPLSPESDYVPRKKAQTKTVSRKRGARCSTVAPPAGTDVGCSGVSAVGRSTQVVSGEVSTDEHSALEWRFVYRPENFSQGQEPVHSISSNTLIPRVWTNSLGGLLTVFPELAKSTFGFSWFQSETPVLLLDINYARGHWINSTALNIDLLWDFSCYDSELEPMVQPDVEDSAQLCPSQPMVHSQENENTLEREAETTGMRRSYSPPGVGPVMISASLPTFSTQTLPSNGIPLGEQDTCQGTSRSSYAGGRSPIHSAAQNDLVSPVRSIPPCPFDLPCSPENSSLSPAPSGSLTPDTAESQPDFQPRIPSNKPSEVETLLNSHLRSIPLLLWVSHDSGLVPCNLPPEYAYLCMGLFFISDLSHVVLPYDTSSTDGFVQGRVCWSVTLQWAPGGEDALFDCESTSSSNVVSASTPVDTSRDLLHPWWFEPIDTSSPTDELTLYRPRDLRLQFFSFIPLDLLAEFHPSESFPRGWLCRSCGMINLQVFFRHQICQSIRCRSTRDKRIPPGKVDSLLSLRDPYQSSTLIRPTDNIPSVVVSDCITWDDGMQSWIYNVKDGVTLCHVFTGNQVHLQEDATALLEAIQCEVLLRKEDPCSPYFTHSTRLSYPTDGSGAMVPGGTPVCVRTAYYTLCDFVHRYGEMEMPRFGEVRMQAWVNTGSKKGKVLYASNSPVAVHSLGAEVVLKFTPKGGYQDAAKHTALDKGKGRARDEDRIGSPPTEPRAGPSQHPQQDNGDETPFIPVSEANNASTVAENVDEAIAAVDTERQCDGYASGIAMPDSNTGPEKEVADREVAERRVRKQNKVTKDKSIASTPEISVKLVHGDCVVLCGDDFEYQIVRTGTTILVIGFPEDVMPEAASQIAERTN